MNDGNKEYQSFKTFYPYYLSEHQNLTCRRLHVLGSFLVLICLFVAIIRMNGWLLLLMPVIGYGFAWVGHFFFEKNRPATFTYPLFSFWGDWVMFWQWLKGDIKR